MKNFTVQDIINLMISVYNIQIFVTSDTYEFPINQIPEEVFNMKVETIDNPEDYCNSHPLCLNLDEDTNFDNYAAFKAEFKDYLL